jgi:methylmalonyl-CoA/ethylmalonyl-CoA epimerase
MSAMQALKLGKLNHVAMAVPDLAKAAAQWRGVFGAKVSDAVDLPEHGVTTVFVELENTKFELLHPFGANSPIASFLAKNPKGGIHHCCIEVPSIAAALKAVKDAGIRTTTSEPKIGAHGLPVLFLHPVDTNGCLIELEERKD